MRVISRYDVDSVLGLSFLTPSTHGLAFNLDLTSLRIPLQ